MLTNAELLTSDIVANSVMNRQRGLAGVNSYERELSFDLLAFLENLSKERGRALWYDACCGEGKALIEAANALPRMSGRGAIRLLGVDLVDMFAPAQPPNLSLVTGDVNTFAPERPADLITCVHGIHYLGDKLGFLEHAYRHLAPGGILLAHIDISQLRFQRGKWGDCLRPARSGGAAIRIVSHLLKLEKNEAPLQFGACYLGATVSEKPNYTGITGIDSWYARAED
jgi:SAM-dependent methyltransferase